MSTPNAFDVVLPLTMTLGESPVWHAMEQALYWVDIERCTIHRLDPVSATHHSATLDEAVACITPDQDGRLLAATRSGLWQLDATLAKAHQLIEAPYATACHRFNDGGCDPAGRFWIGTMDETRERADAALYRYDGARLTRHLTDMTITNGLAFSPDGAWLYHTDTPTRRIRRHRFDPATGEIGPGERWIDLETTDLVGYPDGAAVDTNGDYWVALFGGAAVARFDPTGQLVARYPMQAKNPTMPCFGGADRTTLYVTTAREGLSDEALTRWPDSGALLAMDVATPGLGPVEVSYESAPSAVLRQDEA